MKLLHLYYDLMNLYGEYANMAVLASRLKDQGLEITVDRKTLGDAFDCSQYDFIYLGAGMESSQKAALSDLLPHRGELASAIGQGSVLLFTGNAFELLGSSITDASGREYPALGFSKSKGSKPRCLPFPWAPATKPATLGRAFAWEMCSAPI